MPSGLLVMLCGINICGAIAMWITSIRNQLAPSDPTKGNMGDAAPVFMVTAHVEVLCTLLMYAFTAYVDKCKWVHPLYLITLYISMSMYIEIVLSNTTITHANTAGYVLYDIVYCILMFDQFFVYPRVMYAVFYMGVRSSLPTSVSSDDKV